MDGKDVRITAADLIKMREQEKNYLILHETRAG